MTMRSWSSSVPVARAWGVTSPVWPMYPGRGGDFPSVQPMGRSAPLDQLIRGAGHVAPGATVSV